jgi:uncharacterized zinc-type alcohol dehydrogenase-like protein
VCHSDLHTVRSEWGTSRYHYVPKNEIVGQVSGAGHYVIKFRVGDLAGVDCLVDFCREGKNCYQVLEPYCEESATSSYNSPDREDGTNIPGGFANVIITDERFVLLISGRLPPKRVVPLLCAGITIYSPLRHWKVGNGHKVNIHELGGLGRTL